MACKGYISMKKMIKLSLFALFVISFSGCNEKNEPVKEMIQKKEQIQKVQEIKTVEPIEQIKKDSNISKGSTNSDQKTDKICIKEPEQTTPNPTPKGDLVAKEISRSYPKIELQRQSCDDEKGALEDLDFDIIKKGFEDDNTLLVVGGIQGDEPGGFMAASLLATKYKIVKGSVWVIPNLNFYSIIKRSRGPYGDMNRKFAHISKDDPDYKSIQRIKKYIKHQDVKLILNLHDGSGYYRPTYIDKDHNPRKWGQSVVIDQAKLENIKHYNNLEEISKVVVEHMNKNLIKKEDFYRIKNTNTKHKTTFEEKEMAKTLTYFAIKNGKSAFGHETSKSLSIEDRVYYKLLAFEKYMDIMDIKYKRDFNLDPAVIKNILDNDIDISLYNGKIKLPLAEVRNIINYFPVKKDGTIDFIPNNPLVSIIREHDLYTIYYGNRRVSRLKADFVEHTEDNIDIDFNVDGIDEKYKFGDAIDVKKEFLIKPLSDYRINVIGYINDKDIETDVKIEHKDMLKRFSIDKSGLKYRIEFYKNEKFAGMIVVNFIG